MRKILALIFLVIAASLCLFFFLKPATIPVKSVKKESPLTGTQLIPTSVISQDAIFVPYWSEDTISGRYATYVYFAVTPSESGISTTDNGYKGLAAFLTVTQGKQTLLTISMTNDDATQKIIQDTSLQENIIQDTLQLVNAYGFSGVVLDLEYHGLAFSHVTQSVTNFSTRFAQEIKAQNLLFYQTLFGDTLYLDRPYDVGTIAKAADGIFVLAYDFHKANGTPGPNFPLVVRSDADYDFSTMVDDFLQKVPVGKMTIIFGMFGYDWTVDLQNRPEKTAESLSDTDIQAKFLTKCPEKNCWIQRNSQTQEPFITYADNNREKHIVWFEDMQSIIPKEKVLQQNGISHIGFWANGYF